MAITQYALPLDANSLQSGDITFKQLKDNSLPVDFKLTNVTSGMDNGLNLKTSKGGLITEHNFSVSISAVASTSLSAAQVAAVYSDAAGGDWDYVEAKWVVGNLDTPNKTQMAEVQNSKTYDMNGWPPKTT